MTEYELQQYLKTHYPKENEGCEWKEFKNLKNDFNGKEKDDVVSYVSALANMEGGHLVVGVFMTSEKSNQHQDNVSKGHSVTPEASGKVQESIRISISKNQDFILLALQRDPHMTIPELSELVGISERNISENLKKLQALGLLERIGSRKKGYWKVNQR